ncbi:MAG TPA: alpha/beta fold hydrolase [Rhodanobacteraceae bacterium]|nr:alpha/beta fold hydrolase [Rhodanobacteraceae bacterium]
MRENGTATVVCVHGAGGGGWEWAIWARVFAQRGFAVIAPDLKPSIAGIEKTSFADYRDQVIEWCLGAGQGAVLMGASLGGLLALSVAHALRPSALILVNPLPPGGVLARPLHEPWPAIVPWARTRSLVSTQRAMPDADDAARLFALRRWRDESGAVLNEARDGIAVDAPRCPTLFLASEDDADMPPAAVRALAVRYSADFRSIPGASHVGPLLGRAAAAVAAEAAAWLAERAAEPQV